MKVSIQNLGAVKDAHIEVGNLTIVAGENSTGKTNLVYTIYDVIKNTQEYFEIDPTQEQLDEIDKILVQMQNKNKFQITIKIPKAFHKLPPYKQKISNIKSHLGKQLLKDIQDDFKIKIDTDTIIYRFQGTFAYSKYDKLIEIYEFVKELNDKLKMKIKCGLVIKFEKDDHLLYVLIREFGDQLPRYNQNLYNDSQIEIINEFIRQYISSDFSHNHNLKSQDFQELFIDCFSQYLGSKAKIAIATSDRAGIISFLRDNQKKLRDVSRDAFLNKKVNLLSDMMYTKPTQDNIDFLNGLPDLINIRKRNAKIENNDDLKENYLLKEVYQEIEKLIGGVLTINQMGDINFKMFKSNTIDKSLINNTHLFLGILDKINI